MSSVVSFYVSFRESGLSGGTAFIHSYCAHSKNERAGTHDRVDNSFFWALMAQWSRRFTTFLPEPKRHTACNCDYISDVFQENYWTGLNRRVKDDTFVWDNVTGTPIPVSMFDFGSFFVCLFVMFFSFFIFCFVLCLFVSL